jgi:hypothetical protein
MPPSTVEIGGALTLNNLPSFGVGSTYAPVNADGGKAYTANPSNPAAWVVNPALVHSTKVDMENLRVSVVRRGFAVATGGELVPPDPDPPQIGSVELISS